MPCQGTDLFGADKYHIALARGDHGAPGVALCAQGEPRAEPTGSGKRNCHGTFR